MRNPLVIDIHAHYYPESYMQVLARYGYPYGTVYSNAAPANAAVPGLALSIRFSAWRNSLTIG